MFKNRDHKNKTQQQMEKDLKKKKQNKRVVIQKKKQIQDEKTDCRGGCELCGVEVYGIFIFSIGVPEGGSILTGR